ncbi:DeoR/GlpR family DNA-binding transcription regulator [Amnibacterium flavum]|uniref:DeoR/GlpR transcriptional regulator n=1 Tax=Amnibacterium flavum TaxID=2173173 RepID=A0A2V1HW05_9MICO|nr:DeoR/GlpR family DNA-binding transcription regulator [Amnibacterium flavum]PVZ95309.1 DeoR/GlpR transcriptional regulator [Amnibacterium flavum]
MAAKTRRALIEQRVIADGEIDFATLAEEFDVSAMTIRRDVEALEASGIVRRVVGGAILLRGKAAEPSFETRAAAAAEGKMHIAEAAVDLLQPHETVILDSGSSVLAVAKAIRGRGLALTIVTPSILVAVELADEPDTTVLMAGGRVRPGELSLIGSETEETFSRYNCDTYVMGIAGVDSDRGVSEYHREEGSVKRAAMKAADRVIVVADETKLGRVQLMSIAPLSAVDALVTDGPTDHPALVGARAVGANVVCVPGPGREAADLGAASA